MRLAAIPLIVALQGLLARQVHTAFSTAHHWQRGLLRLVGRFWFACQAAPEPESGRNQDDPEQQTKQTHVCDSWLSHADLPIRQAAVGYLVEKAEGQVAPPGAATVLLLIVCFRFRLSENGAQLVRQILGRVLILTHYIAVGLRTVWRFALGFDQAKRGAGQPAAVIGFLLARREFAVFQAGMLRIVELQCFQTAGG